MTMSRFTTDQQTLDDLNLIGRYGAESVYTLFSRTSTRGGAQLLEELFRYPLADAESINRRAGLIRHLSTAQTAFPFHGEWFDAAEQYLDNTDERTRLAGDSRTLGDKLAGLIQADAELQTIQKGMEALLAILRVLKELVAGTNTTDGTYGHGTGRGDGGAYRFEMEAIGALLKDAILDPLWAVPAAVRLPYDRLAELDALLRFRNRELVRRLLRHVYYLDVCITVARLARERGYAFAAALPAGAPSIIMEGVYHPLLKDAVPNTVEITPDANVLFLTGANMAGKSTLMKTLGISLYLGHMGFPVPARSMAFTVLDGIFTTINLPDNLGIGASHFYAEVLRVKKIAQELSRLGRLFVVFDELFRGTNVKDAYEGTIAIAEAFAARRESIFVISTHIVEAGAALSARCDNIGFRYMPTILEGAHPKYTYQLTDGITDDRHGMIIIRNEGILDILKGGSDRARSAFVTDDQTMTDLNLLGKYRRDSIYSLFCNVHTRAGERLLDQLFRNPLDDADAIHRRSALFRHFGQLQLSFPITGESFEAMENFLDEEGPPNLIMSMARNAYRRATASIAKAEAQEVFDAGLRTTLQTLHTAYVFLGALLTGDAAGPYSEQVREAVEILNQEPLGRIMKYGATHRIMKHGGQERPGLPEMATLDYALRTVSRDRLRRVREILVDLDVFIAVGNLGRTRGWTYAMPRPAEEDRIHITGLRHPALERATGNDITLDAETNLLFLTGANMAGKSTFMKSFGIAVYLAHIGFPVAADSMSFSIREGLFSSINVADDLEQGHSHFYAEVLRVKNVARSVAAGKRLVVLFDELFKGTNVKDAYDGTLAVAEAFAAYRECLFIISTHIVEVGEALGRRRANILFRYLPTIMEGNKPRYTYVLREGIAADRMGMTIIGNEGILTMLKK